MIDQIAIGGILVALAVHLITLIAIGLYHKPKSDSTNSGAKFG